MLNLNQQAIDELKKVDKYDFDIFTLRETTNDNELVTLLPFILARHGLFASCNLHFGNLMSFVRALASGYKSITYHN